MCSRHQPSCASLMSSCSSKAFTGVSSQCQQCRPPVLNSVLSPTFKRHRQLGLGTGNQQPLQQEMVLFTAGSPQCALAVNAARKQRAASPYAADVSTAMQLLC